MHHHMTDKATARRDFLKRAGLGCGSLALTSLLHQEGVLAETIANGIPANTNPLAVRQSHHAPKAKSIIWLFQTGSPSQVDTFDYKPELQKRDGTILAGADPKTGFFTTSGKCLKSPFMFSQHGESGAWTSEIFPHISKHVDDIAFVYSCYSQSNNHTPAMLEFNSGMIRQGFPSMGSWLTYGLGSENENLPAYVVMHGTKPRGADPIWSSGFLPSVYQATALDPRGEKPIDNLQPPSELSGTIQRSLLDTLNSANRKHSSERPFDRDLNARLESFELAYRMQTSAPEAFDLSQETPETQESYGLNRAESKDYGRQCLIARRLVERGVRFIQIFAACPNTPGGAVSDVPWDAHNDINGNHRACASTVDQPTGALLADLKQRGLLDDTIVIYGGEFGRTSDSQDVGGRDHNPHAFTTWFAGGGFKGGTQYGASDEFGYKSVEQRVNVHDIHATILNQMGIDHTQLTYRFNGRDFRLTDVAGDVLQDILS
ncbi:DUF1501 domain-containing protein [Rubinisphaera sp.]|uniref:DUF1501 domain-containing protein n=1 Tax=Rubinisphaera sp. TaxID=2024857 RepID=UPI000C0D1EAA|nr:DUF1501 domain-containing protein [Rubinisphaera sp.]MBV09092.1 hypothetical protein [Rubinisphaera sp.]|tara:strand:+ start:1253 stop:2716 length:1464 start_codon:yes stop_codon:yes gene_type:complete